LITSLPDLAKHSKVWNTAIGVFLPSLFSHVSLFYYLSPLSIIFANPQHIQQKEHPSPVKNSPLHKRLQGFMDTVL
jgi:hypothetical protein